MVVVSIRSFLSKLARRKRTAGLDRAEQAYVQGRQADAATLFRTLAEAGLVAAQLRLTPLSGAIVRLARRKSHTSIV